MTRALSVIALLAALAMGAALRAGEHSLRAGGDSPRADPSVHAAIPPEVASLLASHCVDCHEGPRAKGGFELASALAAGAMEDSPLRAVRRRLARRDMPPADEPERPSREAYRAAVAAIDAQVAPATREVPAVRRLNRDQYARSVRDVLGAESLEGLDVAAMLPRDEIGEGFDTTAATLVLPPALVEKYFDAAEAIAARAVPGESLERRQVFAAATLERRGAGGADRGFAWLATHGTLAARFTVGFAGTHRIAFAACEQAAGDAHARLEVLVDGERVAEHEVAAGPATPAEIALEREFARGGHTVAVRFLNDYWDPKFPDPARRDRNLGVGDIVVTGPLGRAADSPFEERIARIAGEGGARARLERVARVLGEELFRRPLVGSEANRLVTVAREAAGRSSGRGASTDWDTQVRTLVVVLLVDPRFLLRVERSDDGSEPRPLDGFELASRLSYFLWSSVPDEELRAAAARGELAHDDAIRAQVARMLADPRASSLAERFATQWLGIDGLEQRQFEAAIYPSTKPALLTSMRRETELLFDGVARGARPVRDLLDARTTHVDAALAAHYGLDAVPPTGFHERALPAGRGAGVLGHGSVLAATSNPTRTSPVKRGKWVLEALLDAAPPPPPPGVPQLPETAEARAGLPMRELMRIHRENPDCLSCHVRMDAIGLAFEGADADGRMRAIVDGAPVDDTTQLADGSVLRGIDGVRALVAKDDAFERSLVRHLVVYALGRGTADADDAMLDALAERLRAHGSFRVLVEDIVLSDAFRTR